MKRLFTLLVLTLIIVRAGAQAPEKMSYQAVVRDVSGNLITNNAVGIQVSILQGSATGTAVYVETQNPSTNANGLISMEIGGGVIQSGSFSGIDWSTGVYFIKTEIDPAGGNNYSITGISQLLSVPYALYAKTSGSSTPGPQGTPGAPGIQGPAGSNGVGVSSTVNNGNGTYTFNYTDGSSFTTSNLTGPQGTQGTQGLQGLQGTPGGQGAQGIQGPAGSNGVGVSSTVNNGNGTYTFNYTDGSSFTTSNLTGPQGTQGTQGLQGTPGVQGAQGIQGPAGLNGVGISSTVNNGNGTYTFNYTDGSSFTTANLIGAQGPQGASGVQGIQGPMGPQGAAGTQGIQGPAGNDGMLTPATDVGNTPFWNGTQWVVSSSNLFHDGTKVGINNNTPGATLDVNGTFKLTDGNQGDGKYLISDAQGNATWKSRINRNINGLSGITFNSGNTWLDVVDLTETITLTESGVFMIGYNVSNFNPGPNVGQFFITRIVINGIAAPGTQCIQGGASTYLSNDLTTVINLPAGTHTIKVQYRSTINTYPNQNYPAGTDYNSRNLFITQVY